MPLAPATIASALAQLAVDKGTKAPILINPQTKQEYLVYYILEDDAGMIVVAENVDRGRAFQTEVECSTVNTVGYVSSRTSLFCQDVLPPRHRQVLCRDSRVRRPFRPTAVLPSFGPSFLPSFLPSFVGACVR